MDQVNGTPKIRTRVHYHTMAEPERRVSIALDFGETGGTQDVPFLAWGSSDPANPEARPSALVLDDRLMLTLEGIPDDRIDALVEFIANAIAIGAGYPSIYYLEKRMPFRG